MSAPSREVSAAWATRDELADSMASTEGRRITIKRSRRTDSGEPFGRGDIVALVLRLQDKQLEFRTLAMVLAATTDSDLEVEMLPEEEHVSYLLSAYLRGEGIPYAHRYGRRARLKLPVEWTAAGAPQQAFTRDVGDGGAWIVTDDPPPAGTLLKVRLQPGDGQADLTLEARVVAASQRRTEGGMGVEFLFNDRDAARAFQRWFGSISTTGR